MTPAAESVVLRALAKDPDGRWPTVLEFGQALQTGGAQLVRAPPPATPIPAPVRVVPPAPTPEAAPLASSPWFGRLPAWAWAVGGLALAVVILVIALGSGGEGCPTPTPVAGITMIITPSATPTTTPSPLPTDGESVRSVSTGTSIPTPAPTAAVPPTENLTLTPIPFELRWTDIGESVRRRDLSVAIIGNASGSAIVIVGSIEGDQTNTRDLTNSLINYFERNPQQIPSDIALYFVPSMNPDGNASSSRYNANGVDLNRNWDTTDWRANAPVPGYPNGKAGTGGSHPFSEPETIALRDFFLMLERQARDMRVVVLHSSVRRSQGEVYPGSNDATSIAYRYASVSGYDVESEWAEYATPGELVTWCAERGITSVDVVIPGSHGPSSRVSGTSDTLLDITVQALLEIADFP